MPSIQPVVVTDRSTTPVNYTLNPTGPSGARGNGVARVAAADATGNVLSEKALTISSRRGSRLKTVLRFSEPVIVTETINGVSLPRIARVHYADTTFSFAPDSLETERNNFVGMYQSLFSTSKVLVHDTVVKANGLWGT